MNSLKNKLYKNELIKCEKLYKLTREEKHELVKELLESGDITQRELARQLDIPYSTIHDWYSLRQDNSGENKHLSLRTIQLKIESLNPADIQDWGRIEMIRDSCENLLRKKGKKNEK